MKNQAIVRFVDAVDGQQGVAIIRIVQGHIALTLSKQEDGDIEVTFLKQDCSALAHALQQMMEVITPQEDTL